MHAHEASTTTNKTHLNFTFDRPHHHTQRLAEDTSLNMADKHIYTLDPRGDVILTLVGDSQDLGRYLVSSRHLALASPVFQDMMDGQAEYNLIAKKGPDGDDTFKYGSPFLRGIRVYR